MNVPIVVPNAAAASAEVSRMTNNASGSRPQFNFITKMPNTDQQEHLHKRHHDLT